MLFQNSCVVPFGITAIVSFFFPPVADPPGFVQLSVTIMLNTIKSEAILRMSLFSCSRRWNERAWQHFLPSRRLDCSTCLHFRYRPPSYLPVVEIREDSARTLHRAECRLQ